MKSKQDLTVGNINKKLWVFAIPLMLGNVMQQFYNLVDTWVVGKYIGDNALAAVGSSYSLMTFLTSVILGLCLGSSAFFSITFGEKNIKRLKNGMFISFVMIGIFSLILTFASFYLCGRIMKILQVPYDIQGIMSEYLKWIFVGIFATFLYNYFSNLLRGIGNSVIPLAFLCVSVILNIGLDLYFVLVLKQGIRGAAIATLTARILEFLIVSIYIFCIDKRLNFKPKHLFLFDKIFALDLFQHGLPVFINEVMWSLGVSAQAAILGHIKYSAGDPVAANSIASMVQQLSTVVIFGIANAAGIIIGKSIGSGKIERAKVEAKTLKYLSYVIGVIACGVILLLKNFVINFYTIPPETKALANELMVTIAFITIFVSVSSVTIVGILRGGGDTRFCMVAEIITLWCVATPLALIGSLLRLPVPLVLILMKSDEPLKSLVAVIRINKNKWIKSLARDFNREEV